METCNKPSLHQFTSLRTSNPHLVVDNKIYGSMDLLLELLLELLLVLLLVLLLLLLLYVLIT